MEIELDREEHEKESFVKWKEEIYQYKLLVNICNSTIHFNLVS